MEVQIAHQLTNFTRANQLEDDIDFIISVGDNFYEDGVQNVTDPLWDRLYERVFSDPVTQHPWYIVAGNHDYGSPANITAQVEYTQRSNRWYFPALHYSKTYQLPQNKTMAVIYMYTGALADGTPEEGKVENDWLESQLQLYSLKTEFLFVVGHHPVISVGEHGNTAEMVHAKMLFDKYGVTAYFGGHDHIMQYLTDSGIHYFGSGGGCKLQGEVHPDRVLPTTKLVYAEHINGFMVNTVAADGMSQTVTIVNQDGVAVGKYTIQGRQKIIQ
jgi:tartrate-resistant acid phosphatase type 5